jgi:signal transduction histidine kinase
LIEGPYTDRWGKWISPLAYFSPSSGGDFIVGLDLDAKKYMLDMVVFSIIPSLVFLFIFFLIWIAYFMRSNEHKMMEAKSKFISTASHDLRSPLTGISWSIENILRSESISDSIKEKMEELRGASAKLLELIDGLMDLSLIEGGTKKANISENSVLSEILTDVYKCQRSFADSKDITLSGFELIPNLKVKGGAPKIYSVFNNIVSNAIKYTNNNGLISLNINVSNDGSKVDVYIVDNGIGIPKEDLLKVSEGFFRSENAKRYTDSGVGYGLYNSELMIKSVGGSIQVDSEEGKGTKVIVSLLVKN